MKRLLLLLLLSCCYFYGNAQLNYRSVNSFGMLAGSSGSKFQVLTIHGINYLGWYAGFGTGIDNYYHRTVPVFFTLMKDVWPKKTMFLQLNTGTHFLWEDQNPRLFNSLSYKALPGFFTEAGVGFRINMGKEGQGLLFGTYYSYKSLTEKAVFQAWCNNPPCNLQTDYFNARLTRWAFKMGMAF